jgi:flagellar biosynthetic protein FliO
VVDPARWTGGSLMVAGLIWGAAQLLRRWQPSLRTEGRRVQVLELTPIAPRRSLMLVQVGDRQLLLGCSEHGLSTLAEFAASDRSFRSVLEGATSELRKSP